jgi:hypothetical protein
MLSTILELGSMDYSLTTDHKLHRLLFAKFDHVVVEIGGECIGFAEFGIYLL